jgi:hypothetical protein
VRHAADHGGSHIEAGVYHYPFIKAQRQFCVILRSRSC